MKIESGLSFKPKVMIAFGITITLQQKQFMCISHLVTLSKYYYVHRVCDLIEWIISTTSLRILFNKMGIYWCCNGGTGSGVGRELSSCFSLSGYGAKFNDYQCSWTTLLLYVTSHQESYPTLFCNSAGNSSTGKKKKKKKSTFLALV